MTVPTPFSPSARQLFRKLLIRLDHSSEWGRLPPLDVAMHPSYALFEDDLSDARLCNDIFIESRVVQGNMSAALCVLGVMHNMMLFVFIAYCISEREIYFTLIAVYVLFGVGFCLNLMRKMIGGVTMAFVRFNRQAQLVHIWPEVKDLPPISLPWREAVPFTNMVGMSMAGSNILYLLFPNPDGVEDDGHPMSVPGALRFGEGSVSSNLQRLEFLRRYMAHGLDAVRPDPAVRAQALTGYAPPCTFEESPIGWLADKGNRIIYYAGGGPLIDRWIGRVVDNFKWPAEVEQLCTRGIDLSGIDTTPVSTHPNLFYRYGRREDPIVYVDARGNVI